METNSTRQPELFIRDKKTGRLVFNPRAIEALGLPPSEIARRGYRLPSENGKSAASSEKRSVRSSNS
jgi:hypothetical protein